MAGNANLGNNDYRGVGRILNLPPPQAWTEAARRIDAVHMEQPHDPAFPAPHVDYVWGANGDLERKEYYNADTRFLHLFTVEFTYSPGGLLVLKEVTRRLDGAKLQVHFAYDADENLVSKTLEFA